MHSERKPILIEEVLPLRQDALKSTVVRTEKRGYWISTIPSPEHPELPQYDNTFTTRVFEFLGYKEIVGKSALPDANMSDYVEPPNLASFHQFKDDPEAAIAYHYEVVEKVAEMLEENSEVSTANT